ncbi:translation initiation factor 2 [Streptomyces sp. SID10853]|uniref:translation initiation factor 2 n=1 Tax=Streptomyces sp. SID10853 TaxID=2706028 RepID=UPI001EF36D6D|nr:translation initiation factor 2 [Streptomyces sp. SID10853]
MNNPNSGQRAAGSGQRAAGSGQRAAGSGQRAAGSGQRAAGQDGLRKSILFAARSATALHRLLDVAPVFAGDNRIGPRRFTLIPGSEFGVDALTAIEQAGARTIPWAQALRQPYDLIVAASPKGGLDLLSGPLALLPHGAGFNKSLAGEGSPDSASGLDPAWLLRDGRPLADLHGLSHPGQVARLAARSPAAAARAAVVGDPVLDRMLASLPRRDTYRSALGTGGRRLIALTSTWGPESLLERRPGLPAELATQLDYDAYQLALILHPNEHSRTGEYDLRQALAPALASGMLLTRPYEEWAAVLVAADGVITDHGSTALYAAALGIPLAAACDGGSELIPGTPMAGVLSRVAALDTPAALEAALAAHSPQTVRALAAPAFAERGRSLEQLRLRLYALLGIDPPADTISARPLPSPVPASCTPAAFAVRTEVNGEHIRVERRPAHTDLPAHHLAAEPEHATVPQSQSAALLFRRRTRQSRTGPHSVAWTAAGWTARALADHPGPRTAAAELSGSRWLLRSAQAPLLTVRIEGSAGEGTVVRTDPAAVLSGVHAWLADNPHPSAPATLHCRVAGRTYRTHLAPATDDDAAHEL